GLFRNVPQTALSVRTNGRRLFFGASFGLTFLAVFLGVAVVIGSTATTQGSSQNRIFFGTGVGDTFGQRDVAKVDVTAGIQLAKIDFDRGGQVGRQAGDFKLGGNVRDNLLMQFDRRRVVTVDERERDTSRDRFGGRNTLEINVQHLRLVRVPLHRTQQYFLRLAGNVHVKNRRMELGLTQCVEAFVVVQRDADGVLGSAIQNGRNATSAAQAAARTRSLFATQGGIDFHG